MMGSTPIAMRTDSQLVTPPAPVTAPPASRLQGHAWTRLTDDQSNMDALPEYYTPPTGCPECGSVWTHVEQVAFPTACYRGVFLPHTWQVRQVGSDVHVRGVRLRCYSDHLVEFDGVTLTVVPTPTWAMMGLGLGIYAMAGYMLAMMGRGKAAT